MLFIVHECPAVIAGGAAAVLVEKTAEGRAAAKTAAECHLGNGKLRKHQHTFSLLEPPYREKFVKGAVHIALEQAGEVVFGKPELPAVKKSKYNPRKLFLLWQELL